jgi:hypothetical protein
MKTFNIESVLVEIMHRNCIKILFSLVLLYRFTDLKEGDFKFQELIIYMMLQKKVFCVKW